MAEWGAVYPNWDAYQYSEEMLRRQPPAHSVQTLCIDIPHHTLPPYVVTAPAIQHSTADPFSPYGATCITSRGWMYCTLATAAPPRLQSHCESVLHVVVMTVVDLL